jgi:hypothetical protein
MALKYPRKGRSSLMVGITRLHPPIIIWLCSLARERLKGGLTAHFHPKGNVENARVGCEDFSHKPLSHELLPKSWANDLRQSTNH